MQNSILSTVERVYASLPLEQVKLVNVGEGQGIESLLTNVLTAVRETAAEIGTSE